MFTNTMEKFKKAWPETAVGVISIAAGILLILFSAIAVASPTSAHARASKRSGGTLTVVGAYLKPSPFTTLANAFTRSAEGNGTTVSTSYGSAAAEVEALKGGRSADVVGLDLSTDVDQLADAGVV